MHKKIFHHTVSVSFVLSVTAIVLAAGFSGAVYLRTMNGGFVIASGDVVADDPDSIPSAPESQAVQSGSWPALANTDFFSKVKDDLLEQEDSFIEADLTAMQVSVYKDGAAVLQVPILTKGRPGSWWETPAGLYEVQSKAQNHFSSFGFVYQPWSMAFQGNFFIHGWPYHSNGTPVPPGYSGGCVRLSTEDAKAIYYLVDVNTPVLVYEEGFTSDGFKYSKPPEGTPSTLASVTAESYLAADLKNNHVLLAQDSTAQMPIASVTKLMSALIAAEYINLDATTTVRQASIVPTSVPRLQPGQRINAYQLLYPLLAESSNEAAFALADMVGRERFVSLMNQKAGALGMVHTSFTDPAGMTEDNVSTTEDLFALAKYLLNNRSFILKITSDTVGYNAYGSSQFVDLQNFNVFIGEPGFIGGKVGRIMPTGQTILSLFEETLEGGQERPIVVIALKSEDNAADARAIVEHVRNVYQ